MSSPLETDGESSRYNGFSFYDYTDGASAIDIDEDDVTQHNRPRARRDSQIGSSYGGSEIGDGRSDAVFDGPGYVAIPSSVSRMSHREMSVDRTKQLRRMSSDMSRFGSYQRRLSVDRPSRRQSQDLSGVQFDTGGYEAESGGEDHDGDEGSEPEEEDIAVSGQRSRGRRRRRDSGSPQAVRSVFDNLANFFGGKSSTRELSSRRPSISRRSIGSASRRIRGSRRSDAGSDYALASDDEEEERWGYSSAEDDDSDDGLLGHSRAEMDIANASDADYDATSIPPSPTLSLPNMANDPVFGDRRIDIEVPPDLLEPPPPGPPSRQSIHLPEEDITVRFVAYEPIPLRQFLWRFSCVITFGVLGLLGHWLPRIWLKWVAKEKAFIKTKNGFIVVETPYRDIALFPLRSIHYPYSLETVFTSYSSTVITNGTSTHESINPTKSLKIVDYRYTRFALDPRSGLFSMVRDWRDLSWTGVSAVQNGLADSTRQQRAVLFGQNLIDVEGKSVISLLVDEIVHPFYVFQIASIILWSLDDYYYYAFCIAIISTFSIITTLVDTKTTIKRMREMSKFSCPVNILINGEWKECDSTLLVPGDVVNLTEPALTTVPADMFLMSGDAIVNESMLTGESVPVSKTPAKDLDVLKWREGTDIGPDSAKSFLFAGTRVVRIRGAMSIDGSSGGPALAVVTRIGFNTTKGALIRSMLFPKPLGFQFYQDSIKFIVVLAAMAGLGFLASAVQFIRLGVRLQTIMLRALDLITVVVPPALPATLSIGTSFALSRLRKSNIFCISPNRVNVSGKVNVCCFDKTGTLTEDGLDILGVRGFERNAHRFGELIEDVHDLPVASGVGKASFLQALATCHSLQVVNGEVLGDPLDVKMFNFTQWTIEEDRMGRAGVIKDKTNGPRSTTLVQTIVRPQGSASFRLEDALKGSSKHAHFLELGVIRTFEFVSSLRRMSVIVRRFKSDSMEIYVKGAPEVMVGICDKDSFPDDYDDLLSYYTKRGYRVIAMAGKSIENLTWRKAHKLKREQAESGLRFLGLIIFENKLKPGTTPAITTLREAHLACRMITGDNPLTAVSVARECGLINQAAHCFYPTFAVGDALTPMSKLDWANMDDPLWKLDDYSLKPLPPPHHHAVESFDSIEHKDYTLVVTGDVFRWMLNHAPLETLQRMLVKTQVFARMSPDEKNEVVERLQSLGYTVLMCGDGANDCAALKAADVGLSLSEAEASVAAPFTSRTPDISCVIEVIKEGRAALVTSFSCFKYMALYSLIQFTTITLLYSFASSLGDFQFLYIDLFLIIPVAVTMGRSLPFPQIHPRRPTASLVSKKVLASIIGQVIITSAVQFWAFFWVRSQEWYTPPNTSHNDEDSDKLQSTNYENSALFMVSCFQYILVAVVFSIGPPYRKPMWTNGLLVLAVASLTLFNLVILLIPPTPLTLLLELMYLPFSARLALLGAVVCNTILSFAFENWGTPAIAAILDFGHYVLHQGRRRTREGKTYKAVEGGMH